MSLCVFSCGAARARSGVTASRRPGRSRAAVCCGRPSWQQPLTQARREEEGGRREDHLLLLLSSPRLRWLSSQPDLSLLSSSTQEEKKKRKILEWKGSGTDSGDELLSAAPVRFSRWPL